MRLKLLLPLLMLLVIGTQMHTVYASQGIIRINLPEDMKEKIVHYSCDGVEEKTISFASDEQVILKELGSGNYKIRVEDTEAYAFSESEITLPMWDEENKKMDYDVEVNPKYQRKEEAPKTGDMQKGIKFIITGGISLIFVLIMSCHNRIGCGRMSHKYSNKWRT